jgi:hypothetical protein
MVAPGFRWKQMPGSPPGLEEIGLVLKAGAVVKGEDGAQSVLLHGNYMLAVYDGGRDIVVLALEDGSRRAFVTGLYPGDAPRPPDDPPPMRPGESAGAFFNIDFRADFREVGTGRPVPREGGLFHVSAHWHDLRSAVVSVKVPPER